MEGYGLTLTDWEKLRGLGNYRPFSDVDFALVGEELTCEDLYRLKEAIDDLLLPFSFDISLLHALKNEDLLEHIRRRGVEVYRRDAS